MATFLLAVASLSAAESILIRVHSDHYEVDSRRFSTVDELADALRGRDIGRSISVVIVECGADAKVGELQALFKERGIISVDYARRSSSCAQP